MELLGNHAREIGFRWLIRAAGLGIAMGNAAPAVLAVANDVVATHDEGGIEQVAAMLLAELS